MFKHSNMWTSPRMRATGQTCQTHLHVCAQCSCQGMSIHWNAHSNYDSRHPFLNSQHFPKLPFEATAVPEPWVDISVMINLYKPSPWIWMSFIFSDNVNNYDISVLHLSDVKWLTVKWHQSQLVSTQIRFVFAGGLKLKAIPRLLSWTTVEVATRKMCS